ncbi:MAG: enediyne biosynthesis protein UnbU [Gaiellaceae bacterium]
MTPLERRDAALRRFAISLTAFTIAGAFLLGFEDSWAQPLVALATAYPLDLALESLDAWAGHRPPRYRGGGRAGFVHYLLPAHITALSIALLVYPNARLMPIVFATAVGIGSKFVLRVPTPTGPRHFLNPSNIGIVTTLLVFPWVGISPPYQFTENLYGAWDWIVPLAILGAGTMLNAKLTLKGPLILGWVGGFAAQALIRAAVFGTPFVAPLLPMTGLVFVIYTNYMITDPGTTPFARRPQVVFGLATAATYGLLVSLHVVFGLFFALAIVCALRGARLYIVALAARRQPVSEGALARSLHPAR